MNIHALAVRLSASCIPLAIASFMTGCATSQTAPPKVFDVGDAVAAYTPPNELDGVPLQSGKDDHESVRARFGLPAGKASTRDDDGCSERWIYTRPELVNGDAKMRVLLVDFDPSGVVCRSVFRSE